MFPMVARQVPPPATVHWTLAAWAQLLDDGHADAVNAAIAHNGFQGCVLA